VAWGDPRSSQIQTEKMTTTSKNQPHEASNAKLKPSIATLTKSQRSKLQGFSKKEEMHYTLGVMTMLATTAITFRFPAYYWIWHFFRTIFYLPVRYFRFRKNGWELYLVDWCYCVTYISTACGILALLRATGIIHSPLEAYNGILIRAAFAMSSGPLVWSVYMFRNSIVFHDIDHMTSVFIHMSSNILMWCLRWGAGTPSVIQTTFPEMLRVCASEEEFAAADICLQSLRGVVWCDACAAPPSDFLLPATAIYMCVWAVPYFYFIFVRWDDWIKETKRDTLYAYFALTNPRLNAMFERNLKGLFGSKYAGPMGYMLYHLFTTVTLSATSYVLWHSFLLHSAVFLFILVTAVHNGSKYSFRVFAYRYAEGQLQKHLSVLD